MNVNKALEHFQWRLKNSWRPTKRDIEAYNSIIDFKELCESKTLAENELFAKLFIHQLLLLSATNSYSGKRCLQVIEEILSKSVYDWVLTLQNDLHMCKYRHSLENGLNDIKLLEDFTFKPTEKNTIKFVEREVTRLINKFEK